MGNKRHRPEIQKILDVLPVTLLHDDLVVPMVTFPKKGGGRLLFEHTTRYYNRRHSFVIDISKNGSHFISEILKRLHTF